MTWLGLPFYPLTSQPQHAPCGTYLLSSVLTCHAFSCQRSLPMEAISLMLSLATTSPSIWVSHPAFGLYKCSYVFPSLGRLLCDIIMLLLFCSTKHLGFLGTINIFHLFSSIAYVVSRMEWALSTRTAHQLFYSDIGAAKTIFPSIQQQGFISTHLSTCWLTSSLFIYLSTDFPTFSEQIFRLLE